MFRPMLAGLFDQDQVRYPVYVSPKLDGVRCVIKDGLVLSRSLKPIPNKRIQDALRKYEGHDGELIVGFPAAKDVFTKTVSVVRREDDDTPFKFYVFDNFTEPHLPYRFRFEMIKQGLGVVRLSGELVKDHEQLMERESWFVEDGFEGAMVRDPEAPYKFGRSTTKEGYLLKLKRFVDAEATIVGFEQEYTNDNPAKISPTGRTERGTRQEFMRPLEALGKFIVKAPKWEKEFGVGSGFTEAQRKQFWADREKLVGKTLTFKYQEIGTKDRPRIPIFLRMREDDKL